MKTLWRIGLSSATVAALACGTTGCIRIKSDPVEVKPIEININVRVKIDRELDSFFDDIDERDATIN